MPRFNLFKSQSTSSRDGKKSKHGPSSTFMGDNFMPQPVMQNSSMGTSFIPAPPYAIPSDVHHQYPNGDKGYPIPPPGENPYPPGSFPDSERHGAVVPSRRSSLRSRTPVPSVHREPEDLEDEEEEEEEDDSPYPQDAHSMGSHGLHRNPSREHGLGDHAAFSRHDPADPSGKHRDRFGPRSTGTVTHSLPEEGRRLPGDLTSREPSPILFSTRSEGDERRHRRSRHHSGEIIKPILHERDHGYTSDDRHAPQYYYYVVPSGLNIIFQDEQGNEITRVGNFEAGHHRHGPPKQAPIIVRDEFGRELYRSGDYDHTSRSSRGRDKNYRHSDWERHEERRKHRDGHYDDYDDHRSRTHDRHREHRNEHRSSKKDHAHHLAPMGIAPATSDYMAPQPYPYGPPGHQSAVYPPPGPGTMMIDEYGRQIPMNPYSSSSKSSRSRHSRSRSRR